MIALMLGGGGHGGSGSKPPPSEPRAVDFLAPALFALVADVRKNAARLSTAVSTGAPDAEAIHDFRVALRRLRTVLRPARNLYGNRRLREISDEFRRFAQITGALREEEALRETILGLTLPVRARAEASRWLDRRAQGEDQRRAAATRALLATDAPGGSPSLNAALAHLERRLGTRRELGVSVQKFAEEALTSALEGARDLAAVDARDAATLHALRIRFKRVRYTAELLAPVLGERGAVVAKLATRMQKRLGDIHDLDEALARVTRARDLSRPTLASVRRALVRARMAKSHRVRRELRTDVCPVLFDPLPAA